MIFEKKSMKILVLGHNGMLGHMVVKYLKSQNNDTVTTDLKWGTDEFKDYIRNSHCEYLINCIGCIPQKKPSWDQYKSVNILLPSFLSNHFQGKIIHPTTDCEFAGNISKCSYYSSKELPTALDDYGLSKAYASMFLKTKNNVKQIRTSIIGPELYNKVSLMEWFFKQTTNVNGYVNHFWNGITTLEWTKQAHKIINNWNEYDQVIQLGTDKISKYELLCLINKIFESNKNIISINVDTVNKCLKTDYTIQSLENQLIELKKFYYEN